MLSMTGYGRATQVRDGRTLTVEMKSVNHRYLDLMFKLPRTLMFLEDDARKIVSSRLNRGHLDILVTYQNLRSDSRKIVCDTALFNAYADALEELAEEGRVTDDRTLMAIAAMPDVLTVQEAEEDQNAVRLLLTDTFNEALDTLLSMRIHEGEAMRQDLLFHAEKIDELTSQIEERYPQTVDAYCARLKAAIQELLDNNVDENRLMMEVGIMADKAAIAEETVRLHAHVNQLRSLLEQTEPVGRKIDFLVQEMNREANTISSKSQDVPITKLTVSLKAEIEKLREQVQNIE